MLVTLIGILILVAAAVYVSWPLFEPPAERDAGAGGNPSSAAMAGLEKEKELALAAIKEADFDHRVGKLDDADHAALRRELETRALRAIAALDAATGLHAVEGSSGGARPGPARRTAAGFCPGCGQAFRPGARFCLRCGRKLPPTGERSRRRA